MVTKNMTCGEYVVALASKAAVPGGGGASALAGALGAALGNMVGSLTVGKKKYADVEEDILRLNARMEELECRLLVLADKDAEVFEPLSRAYSLPKDTPEQAVYKQTVMESALKAACEVPLEIMDTCCDVLELIKEYAQKGSALAISDAGVAAVICKAALQGASLNVYINTKLMKDEEYANQANRRADLMLDKYTTLADETFDSVRMRLV